MERLTQKETELQKKIDEVNLYRNGKGKNKKRKDTDTGDEMELGPEEGVDLLGDWAKEEEKKEEDKKEIEEEKEPIIPKRIPVKEEKPEEP